MNKGILTMLTRTPYETDLTDAEWAEIAPYVLPAPDQPGAKRRVDTREVVNALRYLDRTGCQWRHLPHDLPKWSTVRYYFDKVRHEVALLAVMPARRT